MDNELYELYSKRTKYRALRENVINAINILSRSDISDSFLVIASGLNNNYLVDDVACHNDKIKSIQENLSGDIKNLNTCLSSINSKIYSINKEIEEKEAS